MQKLTIKMPPCLLLFFLIDLHSGIVLGVIKQRRTAPSDFSGSYFKNKKMEKKKVEIWSVPVVQLLATSLGGRGYC